MQNLCPWCVAGLVLSLNVLLASLQIQFHTCGLAFLRQVKVWRSFPASRHPVLFWESLSWVHPVPCPGCLACSRGYGYTCFSQEAGHHVGQLVSTKHSWNTGKGGTQEGKPNPLLLNIPPVVFQAPQVQQYLAQWASASPKQPTRQEFLLTWPLYLLPN